MIKDLLAAGALQYFPLVSLTWYTWFSLKCLSSNNSRPEMALTMISLCRLTSMPSFIDCRTVKLKMLQYIYIEHVIV